MEVPNFPRRAATGLWPRRRKFPPICSSACVGGASLAGCSGAPACFGAEVRAQVVAVAVLLDGLARPLHQRQEVVEIVDRVEPHREDLLRLEEVAEVRAREVSAGV